MSTASSTNPAPSDFKFELPGFESRGYGSMTPLRQFKGVPTEVVRKAEGKQFVRHYGLQCEPQLMSSKQPWYRYFDLTPPPEIGELIGIPNASRLVHNFPKLQYVVFFLLMWFLIVLALSGCKRQPITPTLLRIDLGRDIPDP